MVKDGLVVNVCDLLFYKLLFQQAFMFYSLCWMPWKAFLIGTVSKKCKQTGLVLVLDAILTLS